MQMLSFKELQKLFLICHDQGIINGEQLLFLYCSYNSKMAKIFQMSCALISTAFMTRMKMNVWRSSDLISQTGNLVLAENLQIPQPVP